MNPLGEYRGQVALVTGAARGIGRTIAQRLAEEGARVLIADLNRDAGEATVRAFREAGLSADFLLVDLAVPGSAAALIESTIALAGNVHVLVNNARAGKRLALLDETEENWDLAVDVGAKAAFFLAQAVIRQMSAREGCRIVNIASVAGVLATNESGSYHAAKASLLQLTRYLAVAGGPLRARVNAVLPGMIVQEEHRSRFESEGNVAFRNTVNAYQPMGEVGSETDVAEAVLYLCSSRSRYVSGTCLVLDGGATVQEPLGLMLRRPAAGT